MTSEINTDWGCFLPSRLEDLEHAFSNYVTGRTFIDLGSGDGRVVRLARQYGANAVGLELDGSLTEHNEFSIRGDFMHIELRPYDVVYYYLMGCKKQDALFEKINAEAQGLFMLYTKECNNLQIDDAKGKIDFELLDEYEDLLIYTRE